jgi:hypothetical protein
MGVFLFVGIVEGARIRQWLVKRWESGSYRALFADGYACVVRVPLSRPVGTNL